MKYYTVKHDIIISIKTLEKYGVISDETAKNLLDAAKRQKNCWIIEDLDEDNSDDLCDRRIKRMKQRAIEKGEVGEDFVGVLK